jgi:hypothetical protein
MYLTNDELASLATGATGDEALVAIAHRFDCGPSAVVAALANELLAMRSVTGVDASRQTAATLRGRR